jgi:hypothetical protein
MNRRQLESDIERRHREHAIRAGWFVVKIVQTIPNGFPDRLYAKSGRVVLLEWKRPGGFVKPQQKHRHDQLRAAGVEVHVVWSTDDANRILGLP